MIKLFADPVCLAHDAGPGHPERPERLTAILDRLGQPDVARHVEAGGRSGPAGDEEITAVHARRHVELVERAAAAGGAWLDSDTHVGERSLDAARAAAGQCIQASREACLARSVSFCAVRPPGHHATRDEAMGFCLLNNVAIAAVRMLDEHLTDTVVIVDFDVHHGNGTQDIFWADDRVFYLSVHQYPHYPGTGRADERGGGAGVGWTANVPLAAGKDGTPLRSAVAHIAGGAIAAARPRLVLVSAGYDGHEDDPLASLSYGTDDFETVAADLAARASDVGAGLVFCLEGGYDLAALAEGVAATVKGADHPAHDEVPIAPEVDPVLGRCWFGHT